MYQIYQILLHLYLLHDSTNIFVNSSYKGTINQSIKSTMSHDEEEAGTTSDLRSVTYNTLDESVWETFMRDAKSIGDKLKVVLMPINSDSNDVVLNKLRDWDLFGPLIVCLFLSMILSVTAPKDSSSLVS